MALLFAAASVALMAIAAHNGWLALTGGVDGPAGEGIIEAIGLLAAAVVALQISQTIAEEEVIRDSHIGAPTRVRRFLSRFLVVIAVAIAVEALVATFKSRETPELMLYASALFGSLAFVLAGASSSTSTAQPRNWNPRRWNKPKARIGSWSDAGGALSSPAPWLSPIPRPT